MATTIRPSKKTNKQRYCYFWKTASPFSQWHPVTFKWRDITFNCAEQAMMYGKAMLFEDEEAAAAILREKTPKKQKALGRGVRGFDEAKWAANREELVYSINMAKFQEPSMKPLLMATGRNAVMVEASPVDRIWGIGLNEKAARAMAPESWPGLNLLGKCLSRVKQEIWDRDAAIAAGEVVDDTDAGAGAGAGTK